MCQALDVLDSELESCDGAGVADRNNHGNNIPKGVPRPYACIEVMDYKNTWLDEHIALYCSKRLGTFFGVRSALLEAPRSLHARKLCRVHLDGARGKR